MESTEPKPVGDGTGHTVVVERRWYLSMAFMIAINFCLFISMWYITMKAQDYGVRHSEYLGLSWGIFFIILVAICIALFTPSPQRYRQLRTNFYDSPGSQTAKNIINISSGALTFILVVLYLFVYAIPAYNKPKWETKIELSIVELPIPGFAYIITQNQTNLLPFGIASPNNGFTARINANNLPANCTYITNSTGTGYYTTMLITNASALTSNFDDPQGNFNDILSVTMNGTWNGSTPGVSGDIPVVDVMAFDARVDPQALYNCNMLPSLTTNAFASTYFEVTASRIKDDRGLTYLPTNYTQDCINFYTAVVQDLDPPYIQYQISQTASTMNDNNNLDSCDISINRNASCETQTILSYSSNIIPEYESIPGKEKVEMWVEVGAIMGAVQGIAWFAMLIVKG